MHGSLWKYLSIVSKSEFFFFCLKYKWSINEVNSLIIYIYKTKIMPSLPFQEILAKLYSTHTSTYQCKGESSGIIANVSVGFKKRWDAIQVRARNMIKYSIIFINYICT
jgi:hypothetical protein